MKLRSPVRLVIVIVTLLVIIWMCYNFVIALQTGETFSFFGNGKNQNGPINTFVVAGIDEGGYRTDLIMLCQVNRTDDKVSILQIPRDTKVKNRRLDKKINSAYHSGFEAMSEEIYSVTGIRPDHYIMVSFNAFKDIIDALGGVEVNIPIQMSYHDPVQDLNIDLKPGKQKLNGEEAEMYMRFRKNDDGTGYSNGDIGRLEAQQQLYYAVSDKMFSLKGVLHIPSVFFAVKKHTDTDYTAGELFGIMKDVMIIGKDNIDVFTLPGEGKYVGGVSYFVPYENQTKKIIEENFVKVD